MGAGVKWVRAYYASRKMIAPVHWGTSARSARTPRNISGWYGTGAPACGCGCHLRPLAALVIWHGMARHGTACIQVRARYPNGNPQANTAGICFSKPQHPGEGCSAYLSAKGGAGSPLPPSRAVSSLNFKDLDRCKAPHHPVAGGGGSYCSFKYTIFDPPAGHPVYNKPMPDWRWTNNSLFSFWNDPFSRPSGVKYGELP